MMIQNYFINDKNNMLYWVGKQQKKKIQLKLNIKEMYILVGNN